jgi:hypothetical protein
MSLSTRMSATGKPLAPASFTLMPERTHFAHDESDQSASYGRRPADLLITDAATPVACTRPPA